MKLRKRDKRALALLAGALVVWLILQWALPSASPPQVVTVSESMLAAEKRLTWLRQLAGSVPGKEEALRQTSAELTGRERGILQAETAAQAQAQLLEILRRVAKAQTPPLDIKGVELGQVARFGDDYGEVQVSITFESRIEELVNLLADLTKQPEALGTRDLRVASGNAKEKTIGLRLTVSGIVPRRLVPEKKGLAAF